jgi:hypothetical protein
MAIRSVNQQLNVEEVLAALAKLSEKTTSPTIRACLDSAREDIAFLSVTGEPDDLADDDESAP